MKCCRTLKRAIFSSSQPRGFGAAEHRAAGARVVDPGVRKKHVPEQLPSTGVDRGAVQDQRLDDRAALGL